jgi:hypothetical protein
MSGYAAEADVEYRIESALKKKVKFKKPGFFKRWILKTAKEAVSYNQQEQEMNYASQKISSGRVESSIDQPDRAIQFTVYNASGGRVVETRRYDRHKDKNYNGLYIITSEQDFGKEIDKIITMETLRG